MSVQFLYGSFTSDFRQIAFSGKSCAMEAYQFSLSEIERVIELERRFRKAGCHSMAEIYGYWAREWVLVSKGIEKNLETVGQLGEVVQ